MDEDTLALGDQFRESVQEALTHLMDARVASLGRPMDVAEAVELTCIVTTNLAIVLAANEYAMHIELGYATKENAVYRMLDLVEAITRLTLDHLAQAARVHPASLN